MIDISAVMPAYNERGNIGQAVEQLDSFLRKKFKKYELIVVNDGSIDGTDKELTALKVKYKNLRVLNNKKNLGYGATVWKGLRKARGEIIFTTDSDLQFDIRELGKFLVKIKSCDAVIGYRKIRSEGKIRVFNAWGWRLICRVLLGIQFKDIDCAFKLIKRSFIRKIKINSSGATFSAELLYKMQEDNCRIEELPVAHLPRIKGRATGANLRVILRAILEMFKLFNE